jgi:hypothetical protein
LAYALGAGQEQPPTQEPPPEPPSGAPAQEPKQEGGGPAQKSGRLWVPGQ